MCILFWQTEKKGDTPAADWLVALATQPHYNKYLNKINLFFFNHHKTGLKNIPKSVSSSSRRIKINPPSSSAPLVFISLSLCSNTHSESCYYSDYPDELVRSSSSHSAHADCNLEITPNEEFLKNMAAALCCQLHTAPCPNGFPGMESIFPPFLPCRGSS